MAPRPVIGINAGVSRTDAEPPMVLVRSTYVSAVLAAGGVPVVLPPFFTPETIDRHMETCAGFIFTGGPDINAARFGEEPHPLMSPVPPQRERHDFALLEAVMASGKPLLGICLGCQELNVLLGGTIIQDIHSEMPDALRHSRKSSPTLTRHDVTVEAGTRLAAMTGAGVISVNSSHHQAIRKPGAGLRVTAHAPDGIIEAVELPDHPFAIGLQWHPEFLVDEPTHLALFRGLVTACGGD